MRKMFWLVALAAVALGIAAYPRSSPSRAAASESPELARLTAALEDERAERKRDIAKLEAQLRVLAIARSSEAAPAAPGAALEGALPAAEPRAPEPAEPVDPEAHLQRAFDEQTVDSSWASTTEQSLEHKVRAQLPHAQVRSVECHASLCRLETVLANKDHFGQFMSDAFKDPQKRIWAGESFSETPVEGSAGELVVVSYLAREGEQLPPLP